LATVDEVVVTAEIEEDEVTEGVATDELPFSSHRFLSTAFQYPMLPLELGYSRCRKHDLIYTLAFLHDIKGTSGNRYWWIIQNSWFAFLEGHDFMVAYAIAVRVKPIIKIRFPGRKFFRACFCEF
jgi:hypothetical protein